MKIGKIFNHICWSSSAGQSGCFVSIVPLRISQVRILSPAPFLLSFSSCSTPFSFQKKNNRGRDLIPYLYLFVNEQIFYISQIQYSSDLLELVDYD